LPVSSIALFPNDEDRLQIIIHPPAAAHSSSASVTFRVGVLSQENPGDTFVEDIAIETKPLPMFEMRISPERITGRRGIYQVLLSNTSEKETTVYLKASDAQGMLRYQLSSETMKIPGMEQAVVTLKVKGDWRTLFDEQKEFEFEVEATLPEGQFADETTVVAAQLVSIPWYRIFGSMKLPFARLHWFGHLPIIETFSATTEDELEFFLSWAVKGAPEVYLNDEAVSATGERPVRPSMLTSYVLTAVNKRGKASQTIEVNPIKLPEVVSSPRIKVSMPSSHFQAQAGGAIARSTLEIQNLGQTVDKYLVEVQGLDDGWYTRSASSMALMPQASAQVQIYLKPPKKKGVRSGVYPFTITIRSESTPNEATTLAADLEVQPALEFKLAVRPYRIFCRRKGIYRVVLTNTGITDGLFTLDASDLDAGVKFRFKNDTPSLMAWKTLEVPLVARPKRGYIKGTQKRYDIQIKATTEDGNAQSANAELYQSPFMGSWKPVWMLVVFLIVAGILSVVVYLLMNMGGGFDTFTSGPQEWFFRLVRTFRGWSLK
jgi:hypothetical protein